MLVRSRGSALEANERSKDGVMCMSRVKDGKNLVGERMIFKELNRSYAKRFYSRFQKGGQRKTKRPCRAVANFAKTRVPYRLAGLESDASTFKLSV